MLFSDAFAVAETIDDEWFDPILETDTKLFVDPFLIFQEEEGFWADAHDVLMSRFNQAFTLIAKGYGNRKSLDYLKALALLRFPEPREFCLGFTAVGTRGAGGSVTYAAAIADAMEQAITRGLKDLKHFEELGVLNEGIGRDRISDLTCTFLKSHFITYTQSVCRRHGIHVAPQKVYAASFDSSGLQWRIANVLAPVNPATKGPLLLTPSRFLKELPTINANDWFDWYQSEQIRLNLNYKVMHGVDKKTIVAIARGRPQFVQQYAVVQESEPPRPYNVIEDPAGVYVWHEAAKEFVERNPKSIPPANKELEFFDVIETLIDQFQLYVEEQGGWKLLWNDSKEPKHEEAAQLLFKGIAAGHCRANNIVMDREVELGRGPVDFKFSSGYHRRALMEVKRLQSSKFWQSLGAQLPSYLRSDDCKHGWFLVIRYDDGRASTEWLAKLGKTVSQAGRANSVRLRYRLIDARPKDSASMATVPHPESGSTRTHEDNDKNDGAGPEENRGELKETEG